MTNAHDSRVFEDDGTAFAHCSCGWVGQAFEDREVGDEDPPFALAQAYNEHYNHRYRVTQLGLES